MKFTFREEHYKTDRLESIVFYTQIKEGVDFLGAKAEIYHFKDIATGDWKEWEVIYPSSCGSAKYAVKLPYVAAILKAMQVLKEKLI